MASLYHHSPVFMLLPAGLSLLSRASRFFRTWVGLLLGMALFGAATGAHAQTDAKTAEEFLRSSGLWAQLATVAPQMRAGFSDAASQAVQAGVKPTPGELERLSKVIDSAFSAERLRAAAVTTLKSEMLAEHVPALRRWYSSPTGKNITALEEAASAAQAADPMTLIPEGGALLSAMQEGDALLSAMPAARRKLLEEFVAVTRSAEVITRFTVDSTVAMQQGLQSVAPDLPGRSANELRATLETQRPQMMQAFSGMSLAIHAQTYTRLPTAELQKYVFFMKTKAGRHFMDVSFEAFIAAMVDASAEFGRGMPGAKDKSNT